MTLKAPEQVETRRLVLRRPRREDAEAILERYASDPQVTRYLSWARHGSIEDTYAFLDFSDAEWQQWPAGPYLMESRDHGQLLGGAGLAFQTHFRAETGYVLANDSWGKGYATEALQAVVEIARGVGVIRISAVCHIENSASWRVLEKCGFTRERALRRHAIFPNLSPSQPYDVYSYGLELK